MCSSDLYGALSEIVARVAARHGMGYRRLTQVALWGAQQRFLHGLGQRPVMRAEAP